MDLNLENIHSPCQDCFIHGHSYSPTNSRCGNCEFNIVLKLLRKILKENNYDCCNFCKNRIHLNDNYYECKKDYNHNCNIEKDFLIDWKDAFKNVKKIIENCEEIR